MSVSARTFQVLYIIRSRARQGLGSVLKDFSDFIADRRKSAPNIYESAYIAPSALWDLLGRMMSPTEGLLDQNSEGEYTLTPTGSQMADLLDIAEIDACSDTFHLQYKEHLARAVLLQRHRLNMDPPTQRDVASAANISLDSARRGLAILVAEGIAEESKDGRSITYSLTDPPPQPAAAPEPEPESEKNAEAVTKKDDSNDDVKTALAGISDDDAEPTEKDRDEDADTAPVADGEDSFSVRAILQDPDDWMPPEDKTPDQQVFDFGMSEPTEWDEVPSDIQETYMNLAHGLELSLASFLRMLLTIQQRNIRNLMFRELASTAHEMAGDYDANLGLG